MASKYDFFEIVKIVSGDKKHRDINGKLVTIIGKVQHEDTKEWIYGLDVLGGDGLMRRVHEKDLEYTGKKGDSQDFMTGESIKVLVDPKTGKGYISDKGDMSFTAYEELLRL